MPKLGRFNDPASITAVQPMVQRFLELHRGPAPLDECWPWIGGLDSGGYGSAYATVNGVRRRGMAHRLIYVLLVGPISAELTLDHLCRVTACCRPEHLEVVTGAENLRRQGAAQTHCLRGHALVPGNLVAANLRAGTRACLTCHRERSAARRVLREAS